MPEEYHPLYKAFLDAPQSERCPVPIAWSVHQRVLDLLRSYSAGYASFQVGGTDRLLILYCKPESIGRATEDLKSGIIPPNIDDFSVTVAPRKYLPH